MFSVSLSDRQLGILTIDPASSSRLDFRAAHFWRCLQLKQWNGSGTVTERYLWSTAHSSLDRVCTVWTRSARNAKPHANCLVLMISARCHCRIDELGFCPSMRQNSRSNRDRHELHLPSLRSYWFDQQRQSTRLSAPSSWSLFDTNYSESCWPNTSKMWLWRH